VYRSITVITGHVRAPAAAAETISAPKRAARRFVFHDFLSVETGAGVAMDGNGGASWARVCARAIIYNNSRGGKIGELKSIVGMQGASNE
jgi:hypothetical protein